MGRQALAVLAGFAILAFQMAAVEQSSAESLAGALQKAYRYNPSLAAKRYTVPAAKARVQGAWGGYLPRVNATADLSNDRSRVRDQGDLFATRSRSRSKSLSLNFSQTLFDSGRTYFAIRQANQQLGATRENLRDTEHAILFATVKSYVDVISDTTILAMERQNYKILGKQLQLIQGLHKFGDVTRTDVLQVAARVSESQARVSAAIAALQASKADYKRIVGTEPRNLSAPRAADHLVPKSFGRALAIAFKSHPALRSAALSAAAAKAQIGASITEHLPTLSLVGSISKKTDRNSLLGGVAIPNQQTNNTQIFARLSIPIFDSGVPTARTREAHAIYLQKSTETHATRADVEAAVRRAWNDHLATRQRLSAASERVRAVEEALNGIRAEFQLGQRTSKNVLDATQDLLAASTNLAISLRDRVLSTYAIGLAIGRLSLQQIENRSTPSYQAIVERFRRHSQQLNHLGEQEIFSQQKWNLRTSRAVLTIRCDACE